MTRAAGRKQAYATLRRHLVALGSWRRRQNAQPTEPASELTGEGAQPPPTPSTPQNSNPDGKLRVPIQFFIQRPLQARLFKGSDGSGFTSVAVIWLPDVYAWQWTDGAENRFLDVLLKALKTSIAQSRVAGAGAEQASDQPGGRDRWVFLGPSDSDGLAFYRKYPPI